MKSRDGKAGRAIQVGQRGGAGWPANPQEKKNVIVLMCADDGEDYNYEEMDESSSKAASNVIEMEECQ